MASCMPPQSAESFSLWKGFQELSALMLEGTPEKQESPNEDSGQNEDYAQRDNHRLR